jgi:CO dehydrogenase nickel-insertion accessory protein CooC1
MTKVIAFAGKGWNGQDNGGGLADRATRTRGAAPVLAIDADPATNLHLALGLPDPAVGDLARDEGGSRPGHAGRRHQPPGLR